MQLDSRFEQYTFLGEGVSSKVYKAFDKQTQTWVAVKHINPHIANDPVGIERFRRELQITRNIQSPQVIKIYDLKESPQGVFLVMEFLQGQDLSTYLRHNPVMPVDGALAILKQILDVLQACHVANVIHRDIKPHNIFLLEGHHIKLLDFGISRMTTLSDLTQTGASLGSPEYMAPELFSTNHFDPRTDLYAVGVLMFELLSGHLPFDAETPAMLFHQHLSAVPRPLHELRPEIPEWLNKIVQKLLAKKQVDRYQSAGEVMADLKAQRVTSESVAQLKRVKCVKCAAPTLQALPVCLQCGFQVTGEAKGNHQLWCSNAVPHDRLNQWLRHTFHHQTEVKVPRWGLTISENLDEATATVIKKSAEQEGVLLQVRGTTIIAFLKTNPAFMLFTFLVWSLNYGFFKPLFDERANQIARSFTAEWAITPSAYRSTFVFYPQAMGDLYNTIHKQAFMVGSYFAILVCLALAVVTGFWYLNLKRLTRKPIIKKFRHREFSWFREVFPLIRAPKSKVLREMDLAVTESYLLCVREKIAESFREPMETAFKMALTVTSTMGTLEAAMAGLRKQHARAEHVVGTAEYIEMEEAYSRLSNRLVHLRSVINAILSHISIEKTAATQMQVQMLLEGTEQCRAEMAAARQVKQVMAA